MIEIKTGEKPASADAVVRDCSHCTIRHRAVCSRCQPHELVELEKIKSYKLYQPGETIVWGGEPLDFVGTVVTGAATLSKSLEDGRRQIVGLVLPGDFIGRPGREHAAYDVAAVSEVLVCRFQRKPFEELLARFPNLENRLLEISLDELDAAREWMLVLGRKTARERIASFLANIARRFAALRRQHLGQCIEFDMPLTREAMADFLGLTLETVSRQLSALRRDGLIRIRQNRHVVIPDFMALLVEAGEDSDGGLVS